jgi:hypothetical protein
MVVKPPHRRVVAGFRPHEQVRERCVAGRSARRF